MYKDDARLDESLGLAGDISRRTINRGMAWSVPVIVGAVAAPMNSGSQPPPPPPPLPQVTFSQASGKLDRSSSTIELALVASSTATGQIQFVLLDGKPATNLPKVYSLATGGNSFSFSVTQGGVKGGVIPLTYSVDAGKTNLTVSVNVVYPSVTFSGQGGALDPAAATIHCSMTANSTGPGPITFTKLNDVLLTQPVVRQLAAGQNSLVFDLTASSARAGSNALTYTMDGTTELTTTVVATTPTSYDSGSGAKKTSGQRKYASITLVFKGPVSSKVAITNVTSAGDTWSKWPTDPLTLKASTTAGKNQLTFEADRISGGNAGATVTVALSIDGGGPESHDVPIS